MKNLILLLLLIFVLYSCKQKTAEEYYAIGKSKSDISEFQEAILYYTYAININSKYTDAYYNRGLAYTFRNIDISVLKKKSYEINEEYRANRDSAINDLTKAIDLNPKLIDAYTIRAVLKLENGPNVEAFEDYNKLIELSPNKDYFYSKRAKLKFELNDYRSAIDDYQKAFIFNPKNNRYFLEIALIYASLSNNTILNTKEEIANYEKAYAIDTTQAYILVFIADAKAQMKEHKDAVVYYTKYIESNYINEKIYKKTDILIARGKARILAGLIESGLADFSNAGELGNKKAYTAIAEYEGEKNRIESEKEYMALKEARKDHNNKYGLRRFQNIGGDVSGNGNGLDTEKWLGKH